MKRVELYGRVRHAVMIEGLSQREAARCFGIDPRTVRKMLSYSVPPGYVRTRPPVRPKLDPFIAIIDRILEEDKDRPKKQRHTSKRISERLRDEYGFTGKITIVKDYICGVRQRRREMFVPLTHPPGHAQVDFGEALAVIGGVERKIHFLAMSLPHSDACFVKAYPGETTEAFCDGHVSGFSFFGGVPRSILYDNTRIAVARILGDGKRQRTRVFSELRSHYLFEDRFGRPGKGNDKGKVEGIVGYCRRNFLVPMPRFRNFDDLNTHLEACCAKRWAEQLRGHDQTVGERLERDRAVLQRLPAIAYDACDKRPGRVSSLSLVRYRGTDYSVPTRFGHCEVLVRGYVHEVVISCAAEVIARHPRSYEQEDFVFDPLHYLSLLEQKTNALDQAAPLAGWLLPPVFGDLRRLLEARMGKAGKREYVQVLRLIESFSPRRCSSRHIGGAGARRDRLRCGQAPGAVPDREAAATLEPAGPSLSAARRGGNNLGPLVHGAPEGGSAMSDTPQLLLAHHLKALKLPTFLREYDKQARQCAAEGVDHVRYLVRLTELELIDRERRMVERRIRMAKFPAVKSLDSFDFKAMPSLNKMMVLELARCEYIERRENVIALGNSGTGKTHIALGLGLAACQKGLTVGFITAAALVHELIEARDEKRLLRFQKQLAKYKLLIIDELGFVPLSKTGAELLFEVFSQRYEGGSTLVTSNLPFDEWTEVFGSERLTGALLDRLTHHVHILEMNGDSYRLNQSQKRRKPPKT